MSRETPAPIAVVALLVFAVYICGFYGFDPVAWTKRTLEGFGL